MCISDTDYQIRLVGGSSTAALVEIFFEGKWGAVCHDGWDSSDASVVCRQLGIHGPNVSLALKQDGDRLGHLENVDCKGDEDGLGDCAYFGWNFNCYRFAGVMCNIGKRFPIELEDI